MSNGEVFFGTDEIIVSKTDTKGRITYANDVFMHVSGYSEKELLDQPHSMIRHPDMPRCVFKLLWDTLGEKREIFAYVKNATKPGGYYWVLAHVTPSYDLSGGLIGYHSSRRVPNRDALRVIEPLYRSLLSIENSHTNRKDGMNASYEELLGILTDKGVSYDEFIFSLNARPGEVAA